MIRQDLEHTMECQSGRFYILPVELMHKLMKAKDDEDMKILAAVLRGGGDMINLGIEESPAEISVIRKHMVVQDGTNIPVLEMRAAKGDRFLMDGELTRDEYIRKRCKELGLKGGAIVSKLQQFCDEYQRLIAS